jgi:hypothetical protein
MKRGPIVGMPANRPRCPWCHRQLAAWCEWQERDQRGQPRKWRSWRGYNGLFDRLTCALHFATAAHKAGYRRMDVKHALQAMPKEQEQKEQEHKR